VKPPTAVYDIETENWTKYVTGAIRYMDTGHTVVYRDPDKLFDALLRVEGDVWAHNGGKYDHLWFLDLCRTRSIRASVSMAGSRVTRVQVGKLCLRDSYALIPLGLSRAASIAGGASKTSTGLECTCGADCGGYCSIKRGMSNDYYERLEEYLRNDCKVLAEILNSVWRYSTEHGIDLRGTVGGTAWSSAKGSLDLPDAGWDRGADYYLARAGYFGGRCEVYQTSAREIYRYDIHKSYLSQVSSLELPVGDYHVVASRAACKAFKGEYPGIYTVELDIPRMDIPPLPVRSKRTGRVCWPWGQVFGSWTDLELRYALQRGVQVRAFGPAIVWEEREAILAPWGQDIWALVVEEIKRLVALGFTPEEAEKQGLPKWLKFIGNSLTGKLGQDPEFDIFTVGDNPRACNGGDNECDGVQHPPGRCCRHRCIGACGRWDPVDLFGRLWSKKTWRIPGCGHIHWAAYLTAAARVELQRQLVHAGRDAVYCDTDSVYSTRPLDRNLGPGLGEWGFEGRGLDWEALAPKMYSYLSGPDFECHMKGISKRDRLSWEAFKAGETLTDTRGVKSLKQAARGDSWFSRKILERSRQGIQGWVGSRLHCGDVTRAMRIDDMPKEVY